MTNQEAIKELKGLINSCVGREEIDLVCREVIEYLQKQEPRVMTLEEAENRIGDCIYIEIREKNIGEYRMIGELDSYSRKYKYLYVMHPGETHCHPYSYNLLNKIWRTWSAKPTEQQMRDTPWEGEEETK